MKNLSILLGVLGLTVTGSLTLPILARPSSGTKRSRPVAQRTAVELAESVAFEKDQDMAKTAFLQGDFVRTRNFYEPLQRRFDAEVGDPNSTFSTVPDFTIPLAACELAEGDPPAALERYIISLRKYPSGITDLSGRMFYAAYLTKRNSETERILDLIESRTFADRSYSGRQDLEAWKPKDSRTLTLMMIATRLGEDRNRSGFDAAIDLAKRTSDQHPAILRLQLSLLTTRFRDSKAFRSLGLTIKDSEMKRVPSLSTYRHRARWLSDYEHRWPKDWTTYLEREQLKFRSEKADVARDTFAYETISNGKTLHRVP